MVDPFVPDERKIIAAVPTLRPRWSRLTILTLLSAASMMAQACGQVGADNDDEIESELESVSQDLDENDAGGATAATAGGIVGGGFVGGGTVGGSFAGGSTGGVLGGLLGGLGDGGPLLGGIGGTVGGPVDGGGFPGGSDGSIDAGPVVDSGFDSGPPKDDGGVVVPPRDGGILGGDGGFIGGPVFGPQPFANWKFDDCGPSTALRDSSNNRADAVRSAQVSCAVGVVGGAVLFDAKKDTVVAAAHPAFNVANRITLAAWVNPKNVSTGSLIAKALNGTNAYELVLQNGNLIFRIQLDNGRRIKQIVSKAPISANRWTHVAAQYDGSFVRLFENGAQVGQIAAAGVIADVQGPIQIGNNQSQDFLRGIIDEVWLSADVVTAADIARMSCIAAPPSLAVNPFSSGPQDPGATFTYDVAVTNNDVGACSPRTFFSGFFGGSPIPDGFNVSTLPSSVTVNPGTTSHLSLSVTSSTESEPGANIIPVNLVSLSNTIEFLNSQVEYIVKEPTGCFVRTGRELMIRDLSVVEDPLRTTFDGPVEDPRTGVWTFGRLMEQLAPTDADAPDMVEHLFNTWLTDQTINTFTVPARPAMRDLVLNSWPRTANGKLNLQRAPLRLLAIVNRIDSRNLAQGHAGEGRFVFGVLSPEGFQTEFTMIFEFRLPAKTPEDVLSWANRWHALGSLPFPSEEYNAALQAITDSFSRRGSEPGRPNDSALAQLRSNEIALSFQWELREFELSATTHRLEPSTVKLTPDTGFLFSDSPLVAQFINENEAAVLAEQHVVPETFHGQPFLGGSSFNDLLAWRAPGVLNNEARHKFSLNTCNGCHSSAENGTAFLHVFPREPGQVSQLSGFLQGITVSDPVTGAPRQLNDLGRRNADLKQLVCPATPPAGASVARSAAPSSTDSARAAFIAKGINRTH